MGSVTKTIFLESLFATLIQFLHVIYDGDTSVRIRVRAEYTDDLLAWLAFLYRSKTIELFMGF